MKIYKAMIIFFVLTIISCGFAFGLQSTTAYRPYALALFIGLICLFLSFILAIISLKKHKDYHRGLTLFILVCSSLGVIFVIVIIVFIMFFLHYPK